MAVIMVTEKDIDTNRYQLEDLQGYEKKADAYLAIEEQGFNNCTVYYVAAKSCFAIVSPKHY